MKNRILNGMVILCLLVQSLPAWATTPPSCAIFIDDSSSLLESRERWLAAAESLRTHVNDAQLLKCASIPESMELLNYYRDQTQSQALYHAIDQDIDLAKEHWFNFEFEDALALIEHALTLIEEKPAGGFIPLGEKKVHALLVKALILKALNRKPAVKRVFEDALAVQPTLEVDALEFPPGYRTLFNDVKRARNAEPLGQAKITTTPEAATVYVNGVDYGQTPLVIDALPAGSYALTLVANHYLPVERTLTIDENGEGAEEHVLLAWKKSEFSKTAPKTAIDLATAPIFLQAASKQETAADLAVLALMKEAFAKGAPLAADKILLLRGLHVTEHAFELRVLDPALAASHRPLIVPLDKVRTHERFAWSILGKALRQTLREDLTSDPKHKLDPRTGDLRVLNGQRPFYKRPLFWLAVGAVVVGGTVGGILAAQGDGDDSAAEASASEPPSGGVGIDLGEL